MIYFTHLYTLLLPTNQLTKMLWIVSISYCGESDNLVSYFIHEDNAYKYFIEVCKKKNAVNKAYSETELKQCMTTIVSNNNIEYHGIKYYVEFNATKYMQCESVRLEFCKYDDSPPRSKGTEHTKH